MSYFASDQPKAPEDVTVPPVHDPRAVGTDTTPADHFVDADAPPISPYVAGTTPTGPPAGVGVGSGEDLAAPPATLPEDFAAGSTGMKPSGGGSGEGSTMDTVKNWITEHPLLAAGAGIVAGVALAGLGGDKGEHRRRDRYERSYRSYRPQQIEGSYMAGRSMSGGGGAGGIMKLAQQTGLSATLMDMVDRTMRSTNDQARNMLNQRLPAFEDKLHEQERQRSEVQSQPSYASSGSNSPAQTTARASGAATSGTSSKGSTSPR